MATYTNAFASGVAEIPAYGQKSKVRFVQTWVAGDTWTLPITSTIQGDLTLGKGNIAGLSYVSAFKFANRMYLAGGSQFNFSQNGDVTLWEEQDPGAGLINYLTRFGSQDSVKAFASFQGNLVVFGTSSLQVWSVDADPDNFVLRQTIDNTGTVAPLSVQKLGDLDVFFLDSSGIRSLQTNLQALNASLDDVGTAIDSIVRTAMLGYDESAACGIIEPTTKQYWLYLNGTIYVLSRFPGSKIEAWSTFKPTVETTIAAGSSNYNGGGVLSYSGTLVSGGYYYWTKGANESSFSSGSTSLSASGGFTADSTSATVLGLPSGAYTGTLARVDTAVVPEKFVVYNGQVYFRASNGKIYRYGGSDGNTYDHCRATVELPWLDLGQPSVSKQFQAIDAAFSGTWAFSMAANPRTSAYTTVISRGSSTSPSMVEDSTFDIGRFPFSGYGTHIKIKAVSGIAATAAKLGKISVVYEGGATK